MEKEQTIEAENLEARITKMKAQFQQSYDVFIKAHEELSKISFESLSSKSNAINLGPLAQLGAGDINEIVAAGSIDDCISTLRSKIKTDNDDHLSTFPDVAKLLSIMSGLQSDIESLTKNQKKFSKLTEDVDNEMSMLEKRLEDSVTQLDELVAESSDGSEASHPDDESSDVGEEEEANLFGSESFSD